MQARPGHSLVPLSFLGSDTEACMLYGCSHSSSNSPPISPLDALQIANSASDIQLVLQAQKEAQAAAALQQQQLELSLGASPKRGLSADSAIDAGKEFSFSTTPRRDAAAAAAAALALGGAQQPQQAAAEEQAQGGHSRSTSLTASELDVVVNEKGQVVRKFRCALWIASVTAAIFLREKLRGARMKTTTSATAMATSNACFGAAEACTGAVQCELPALWGYAMQLCCSRFCHSDCAAVACCCLATFLPCAALLHHQLANSSISWPALLAPLHQPMPAAPLALTAAFVATAADAAAAAAAHACRKPGVARQLAVLFWRAWVDMFRSPTLFRLHVIIGLATGLLTGVVFWDLELNNVGESKDDVKESEGKKVKKWKHSDVVLKGNTGVFLGGPLGGVGVSKPDT